MGSRTPGNAGTRTRSFPFRRAGHNPPGRFPTQRSDLGVLGYIIVYLETNILLDHYRFFSLSRFKYQNRTRTARVQAAHSGRKGAWLSVLASSAHLSSLSIAICQLTLKSSQNVSAISKRYCFRWICLKSCQFVRNNEVSEHLASLRGYER